MYLLLIASHLCYLIKYLVVFMSVVHIYFYIVVDTHLLRNNTGSVLNVEQSSLNRSTLEKQYVSYILSVCL